TLKEKEDDSNRRTRYVGRERTGQFRRATATPAGSRTRRASRPTERSELDRTTQALDESRDAGGAGATGRGTDHAGTQRQPDAGGSDAGRGSRRAAVCGFD